jgi:hypothetical protein
MYGNGQKTKSEKNHFRGETKGGCFFFGFGKPIVGTFVVDQTAREMSLTTSTIKSQNRFCPEYVI